MKSEIEFELDNEPDLTHVQRIAKETVQYLHDVKQKITTEEIEPKVVKVLKQSGLVAKVDRHDDEIKEIDGFIEMVRRGIGFMFKGAKG